MRTLRDADEPRIAGYDQEAWARERRQPPMMISKPHATRNSISDAATSPSKRKGLTHGSAPGSMTSRAE